MHLPEYLKEKAFLKENALYEAFCKIDRVDFVPEAKKKFAYQDLPLPIGSGQTISQPQVVAFMLKLLDVKKGNTVMDIGFGSGWTTALLAFLVSNGNEVKKNKGLVCGIELVPEVYEFGKKNIEKYNFLKKGVVRLFLGDGREGKKENAPYDCILISAADRDKKLPIKLIKQLKDGGRVVMPINSSIFLFIKEGSSFKEKEYPGFSFVPLI